MNIRRTIIRNNHLILVIMVGLLLRFAAVLIMGNSVDPLPGIYDQISYDMLARRLISGHGFTFPTRWWPLTAAGEPSAHWSYLYTIYLAGVYQLFGVKPLVARLLQATLTGLFTPLLAYRIAGHVLPQPADEGRDSWRPFLAGTWVAVYGYYVYYSAALMTEPFYILAILWALDCTLRIRAAIQRATLKSGPPVQLWIELGLAITVAILLRQVFLLIVPFLFAWLLWLIWRERNALALRPLLARTLLSTGIVVLLITPFTLFNYRQFNRFVLLNTNAGYALFWSNHPVHQDQFVVHLPSYQQLIPNELRHLNEADLERALLQRGIKFIVDDPARYVRLTWSRIPIFFMFWPSTDSSTLSNAVRVASFGLACPFALLGLVVWFKENLSRSQSEALAAAPGMLLVLFMVVYTAIHILTWPAIRYRLPVDAVALVFAAYGLHRLLARSGLFKWFDRFLIPHRPTVPDRL